MTAAFALLLLQALHFVAFNLLSARDRRSVAPGDTHKEAARGGEGSSLIQSLADELALHSYINRFFPVIDRAVDTAEAEHSRVTPTFEDIDAFGCIELADQVNKEGEGGEGGAGGGGASQEALQKTPVKSVPTAEIIAKLKAKQEAEFRSERLPNPFFVREKNE